MVYDKLGRMTQRTEAEGTSTWTYDTKSKGIGKPAVVTGGAFCFCSLSHAPKFVIYHGAGLSFSIGLTTTNTYDSYSRLNIQTRPQNF
jgi:YD repeat-containing protein